MASATRTKSLTAHQLSKKKKLRIVGIMNGTSLDGIDYVLADFILKNPGQIEVQFVDQVHEKFPSDLQKSLFRAASNSAKVDEVAIAHHELGRLYAKQLLKIQRKKKWKIDLVGVHGQTVFHKPPQATFQLGESSYLCAELGVPVVYDFRTGDFALQGQGAPIASLFHQMVLAKKFPKQDVAVQNIGGIGNCTFISAMGQVRSAFDTGPGNMLIDQFVQTSTDGAQKYDKNGEWASSGIPHQKTIEEYMKKCSFFSLKPPKSCGREEFGQHALNELQEKMKGLSNADQLATLTELTARSIAEAYSQFGPSKLGVMLVCGGGAKNSYLLKRIRYHLSNLKVVATDALGWSSESIEGAAFALLAAYKIWGLPSNIPSTTGASRHVILGKLAEI